MTGLSTAQTPLSWPKTAYFLPASRWALRVARNICSASQKTADRQEEVMAPQRRIMAGSFDGTWVDATRYMKMKKAMTRMPSTARLERVTNFFSGSAMEPEKRQRNRELSMKLSLDLSRDHFGIASRRSGRQIRAT